MITTVAGWAGGLAFVAALLGGTWLHGYTKGQSVVRAEWAEATLIAERAARQTESDLAAIAAASAKRISEKERLLHERARRQDARWRALLAGLPACALPRAVGVHFDAASGVSDPPAVAEPPDPDPDGPALDSLLGLAETLDTVRTNYEICRTNIGRLIEAQQWYDAQRARINRSKP